MTAHPDRHPGRALCLAVQAALLGVALPGAAAADEPAPVLELVTVVGKVPQPLSEAAAAVSIIPRERLEQTLAFDVRDALRYEPGITVRNDPSRFGLEGITIRGLGGNRVLLETDGVPAAHGFAVGNFASTGRSFADLELVQRVEVLRGPASTLYGSDAIAGVVATTTVDPADLLGRHDASLRVRSGYASDDHSAFAGVTGALRSGTVESLLAVVHREGSELQSEYERLDANPRDYDSSSALARFVLAGMDAPLRLTVGWDAAHALTDVDSLELSGGRFANTTSLYGDDRSRGLYAIVDQKFADLGPFLQAEWRLYWQDSQRDQRTAEQRRAVAPRTPAVAIDRAFEYRDQTFGGEFSVAADSDGPGGPHRWVAGLEAATSAVEELRNGLQTTLPTGVTTSVLLGESMPVRDFPNTRVTTLGLYLQDDWRPAADWTVIPAVRVDGYWLDPSPDATYREDNPRQVPASVQQWSLSPKLGVSRRLSATLSAFGQYAHGFRAQPMEDVNIGLDLPQFNTRAIPNPDLKPEESDSLEFGLRWSGAFTGSASVFGSEYRDFIESKVNLGRDPVTGTTLFQSRNVARARIVGAEAGLMWRMADQLPAAAGVTLRSALSWTRGDDIVNHRPLNSIDPWRIVAGIDYAAVSGRWGTELTATVVGAKTRTDDTLVVQARTAGYTTLDLTARWQLSPELRLNVGVFNLTDRSYSDWADVRGRAADDPLLELYRRPGRNAALTLTWTP